ncbi:hypothetical protein A5784_19175 [Mycobacterium sp. 852013-50091_SCH5140682]|uniref:hypothetical protein n=1 Tax=Mycobacterium sp. 852013-50091_SCH5140682 TaxID=1834109 RepID=UPI0007EBEB07|nr:hypothetical protein [Mycobacterium sp. 852013-50091_SCH5140682]OBC00859.1 hypothetical protein A5784_19175 [Mycobacterium sp. 852013-50091_SCH5140682]
MTGQPTAGGDVTSVPSQDKPVMEWRDHVLPSDCLLTGRQMSDLAGVDIDDGRDTDIKNTDGTVGHNCSYYATEGGVLSFTASIKVQSPATGVITEQLLAGIGEPGATVVPGIGLRMIIEPLTRPGDFPVMRVATDKYLVNAVLVAGNIPGPPDVASWTRAASEMLASLPA